jgi:hypothetical protein
VLRLSDILLIERRNGYFRYKNQLIPAIRPNNGIGVACIFYAPTTLDFDFKHTLEPNTFLWFPKADELNRIQQALDQSDDETAQMLPIKSWGGVRPRKMKVGDFL